MNFECQRHPGELQGSLCWPSDTSHVTETTVVLSCHHFLFTVSWGKSVMTRFQADRFLLVENAPWNGASESNVEVD